MQDKELILNAIESAERSLQVAKRLLGERGENQGVQVIGVFDGEFVITDEGKRFQIPPNYASKSLLVVGDTMRMLEDSGVQKFKQIKKVERIKSEGVLTKKDGKWAAVCEEGSFWILAAAVKHHRGEIGEKVMVHLPKEFKKLQAKWGALEKVLKEEKEGVKEEKGDEEEKPEEEIKNERIKEERKSQEKTKEVEVKEGETKKPSSEKALKRVRGTKEKQKGQEGEKEEDSELKGEIKLEELR